MAAAFYQWLADSLNNRPTPRDLTLVALDHHDIGLSWLEFRFALIEEVSFPALDAGSGKDTAQLILKFGHEQVRYRTTGGGKIELGSYAAPKLWQIGDFRLQIAGLEAECKAVTRIESLTFKNKLTRIRCEAQRTKEIVPTTQETSHLRVTLPGTKAGGFLEWAQEAIQGPASGKDFERNGTLDYLAPGSSKSFFSFDLRGLGIMSTTGAAKAATPLPLKLEMYCDEMTVGAGPSVAIG